MEESPVDGSSWHKFELPVTDILQNGTDSITSEPSFQGMHEFIHDTELSLTLVTNGSESTCQDFKLSRPEPASS